MGWPQKSRSLVHALVDAVYRKQPFDTERHRIEHLFALYQQITEPLIAAMTQKSRKKK